MINFARKTKSLYFPLNLSHILTTFFNFYCTKVVCFVKIYIFSSFPFPTLLAPFENPHSVRVHILDIRFLWVGLIDEKNRGSKSRDPALCGIAQDQNGIARDQWIKLWSNTVSKIRS
jgi:hypothetical protein